MTIPSQYCWACGVKARETDKFCRQCGQNLSSTFASTSTNPMSDIQDNRFYFERGNKSFKNKDWGWALTDYSLVLSIDPEHKEAYYYRGRCHYNIWKDSKNHITLTRAIDDYGAALGLGQSYEQYCERARCYVLRWINYKVFGDIDRAIKDLTLAIALDPRGIRRGFLSYRWRAWCYQQLGKHDKAVEDNSVAIECFGSGKEFRQEQYDAYYSRAHSYYMSGLYEEALRDYKFALQMQGRVISRGHAIEYNMAECYWYLKNYSSAVSSYTAVIRTDPESKIYYKRGLCYQNLSKYPEAIKDYTSACSDPLLDRKLLLAGISPATIYFNRGVCYQNLLKYPEAVVDYNLAMAVRIKPGTYYNRGLCFIHLEKYVEACDDFSDAIKLNRKYRSAYAARAKTYLHLKRYKEALADYTKLLKLDPECKHDNYYLRRAEICRLSGNFKRAVKEYAAAIENNPDLPEAYILQVYSYAQSGMPVKARKKLDEYFHMYPDDSDDSDELLWIRLETQLEKISGRSRKDTLETRLPEEINKTYPSAAAAHFANVKQEANTGLLSNREKVGLTLVEAKKEVRINGRVSNIGRKYILDVLDENVTCEKCKGSIGRGNKLLIFEDESEKLKLSFRGIPSRYSKDNCACVSKVRDKVVATRIITKQKKNQPTVQKKKPLDEESEKPEYTEDELVETEQLGQVKTDFEESDEIYLDLDD